MTMQMIDWFYLDTKGLDVWKASKEAGHHLDFITDSEMQGQMPTSGHWGQWCLDSPVYKPATDQIKEHEPIKNY